jgi:hypothetical protein
VTSREPLNVDSERRYPVEPLAATTAALFDERARAVSPGFRVTPGGRDRSASTSTPAARDRARRQRASRSSIRQTSSRASTTRLSLPRLALARRAGEAADDPRDDRVEAYELLDRLEQQLFRRLASSGALSRSTTAEARTATRLDTVEALVVKSLLRRAWYAALSCAGHDPRVRGGAARGLAGGG